MQAPVSSILVENLSLLSKSLQREVIIDFYLPRHVEDPATIRLLLINDGQNLGEMGFPQMLHQFNAENSSQPILCVGIHAGIERKMEYGIAAMPDYLGRGAKAADYTSFIMTELLPYIHKTYAIEQFAEKAFAGFSLGGLTALDIVWNHPNDFQRVGVFSGSLWWRSVDQDDAEYNDDVHRLMHQEIRSGSFHSGLKFFFQSGNMDETNDRNNNGIIDSIDDTLDLIKELVAKGYDANEDICYLEIPEGRHDIPTWGKAMPQFLEWGWRGKVLSDKC